MLNFIKKHRICFSVLTILLIAGTVQFYHFIRDQNDRMDSRLFPLPMLSEPSKTVIEYKTGDYTAYYKCFRLAFKSDEIMERFNGNHLVFENSRHNYIFGTEKEFYSEVDGKPHFILNIYKDFDLLEKKEIYMMEVDSSSIYKIDDKSLWLSKLRGYWKHKKIACYYFKENSNYKLEVINDTPLTKFENLSVFLLIKADRVPLEAR